MWSDSPLSIFRLINHVSRYFFWWKTRTKSNNTRRKEKQANTLRKERQHTENKWNKTTNKNKNTKKKRLKTTLPSYPRKNETYYCKGPGEAVLRTPPRSSNKTARRSPDTASKSMILLHQINPIISKSIRHSIRLMIVMLNHHYPFSFLDKRMTFSKNMNIGRVGRGFAPPQPPNKRTTISKSTNSTILRWPPFHTTLEPLKTASNPAFVHEQIPHLTAN